MPCNGGSYGIKVGKNQGISTENMAYGPNFYGIRTPPFMPYEPFLQARILYTHPPHPWKYPSRGEGCIKGGSKYTQPPPSPERKNAFRPEMGEGGGGVFVAPWTNTLLKRFTQDFCGKNKENCAVALV